MSDFVEVCTLDDLVPNSGVAALIEGVQVALFYVDGEVFALNNYDPIGKAYVLSRGMVGDLQGELMVATPLYKQHYSLRTGLSLDGAEQSIPSYPTKVENEKVFVKVEV
jgi:nitrite reductase (NADH) small subunit